MMYNSLNVAACPFGADYPAGAQADAAGPLATDIEGRPLTAPVVAGRSSLGGADAPVPAAGFNALATAATGAASEAVAPGEVRGDAGQRYLMIQLWEERNGKKA